MCVVFQKCDLNRMIWTHKVGHRRNLETVLKNLKFRGALVYIDGMKT